MKLITTKLFRQGAPEKGETLAIMKMASGRYLTQRYRSPGKDTEKRWTEQDWGDNTKVFEFNLSDLLIIEREIELGCDGVDDVEDWIAENESRINEKVQLHMANTRPLWAANWLVIQDSERSKCSDLARFWLKETMCPEHAEEIISGSRKSSMTWLRYLSIDDADLNRRLSEMRVAQLYYAEFDQMNADLLAAISELTTSRHVDLKSSSDISSAYEIKKIRLEEDLRVAPRRLKSSVEDILRLWDFDRLDSSVQKIQDLYSRLISEKREQKMRFSQLVTEGILLLIGLFALFELVIAWSSFGREILSNPILLAEEQDVPLFVGLVSAVPLDVMMVTVTSLVLITFVIYIVFRGKFK